MELKENVIAVLEKVKPALQADGGDINFVEFIEDEKVVVVKLEGSCHGCAMRNMTIKNYVEKEIIAEIPEIKEVRLAE